MFVDRNSISFSRSATESEYRSLAVLKSSCTLEKLTEHEDPQIAERAKAALRQVRGR